MKSVIVVACLLLASPTAAQTFNCAMADAKEVAFRIDPAMFVDAIDASEPIRRKVTQVAMGNARFPAEPFVIGSMRGFAAEFLGGSTIMFVVKANGNAAMSDRQSGLRIDGFCEVQQ